MRLDGPAIEIEDSLTAEHRWHRLKVTVVDVRSTGAIETSDLPA